MNRRSLKRNPGRPPRTGLKIDHIRGLNQIPEVRLVYTGLLELVLTVEKKRD